VDWRQAAEVAVRLVRQAQTTGVQEIGDYVMNAALKEDLDERTKIAVEALVGAGAGIQLNDDPDDPWRYYEGQHRVAAQLDQGVRQTIIQR
jgi:hypothetical protein